MFAKKISKSTNAASVRVASIDDINGIMHVEVCSFPENIRYSRSKILSRLEGNNDGSSQEREYFVAEKEGNIVGYGELAIQSPDVALCGHTTPVIRKIGALDNVVGVLISMGVLPDARGGGIGEALVNARLQYLRNKGIQQVFAHAWQNGGFRNVARKTGFMPIEEWGVKYYADGSRGTLYYAFLKRR